MSNAKQNNIEEYIGKNINFLKVIGLSKNNLHFNSNHWDFECECGTVFSDNPSRILSGHKKSCGCKKGNPQIHGCYNSGLYHAWWSMIQRCYNPSHHNYHRYGERGITVCEEWKSTPENFVKWVQEQGGKPKGFTLDRIDNNKGYSPENCKFSSPKEQANNRNCNALFTFNGETKTLSQWSEFYNISSDVVSMRINRLGWDSYSAFTAPILKTGYKGRPVKLFTKDGVSKPISYWCKEYKINLATVQGRIRRGYGFEEALTKPVNKKQK